MPPTTVAHNSASSVCKRCPWIRYNPPNSNMQNFRLHRLKHPCPCSIHHPEKSRRKTKRPGKFHLASVIGRILRDIRFHWVSLALLSCIAVRMLPRIVSPSECAAGSLLCFLLCS